MTAVGQSSGTIRPEDRLFHLTLALLATSAGLTKEQILSSVRGYREDIESGALRASVERRFERDKDTLRDLGIPLEAWIPPGEDTNNKATRYRIPKDQYDHSPSVVLDAQDIRLLNLAAAVWREGTLSADARVTHTKLASHGVTIDEPLVDFLPMITARDPALSKIRRALDINAQVRFHYLNPGATGAKVRTVSPLGVVMHEGRWHLLSVEEPGGGEKTFLLRRIVSPVEILEQSSRGQEPGQLQRMVDELDALYQSQVARIRVRPGSAASSVLANRALSTVEADVVHAHFTDQREFALELAEFALDIDILSPSELRESLAELLTHLVVDHG